MRCVRSIEPTPRERGNEVPLLAPEAQREPGAEGKDSVWGLWVNVGSGGW